MWVVAIVSRVVWEEGVTHFRRQFLPLLLIENLHPKHEIEFPVCNIVMKMKALGMRWWSHWWCPKHCICLQ